MNSRARAEFVLMATSLLVLAACGGPDLAASDAQSTASVASPGTAASPTASRASASFPIPIPEGGTMRSEFPGEVTFEYPTELYDAVIRFYDVYAETVDVISAGELFPDGYEWQLDGEGGRQQITLTDDGSKLTLFLRVTPP